MGAMWKTGRILGAALLSFASIGWASGTVNRVDTNPMNHDPQVREAFQHFYNLDFPGAVGPFRALSRRSIPATPGHRLPA